MGQNTVSSPFRRRKSYAHFTRIKRDDGWKHLEELRGQFYGQMYKINPEIISRFLIKSTLQSYRLKEPTSKYSSLLRQMYASIRV